MADSSSTVVEILQLSEEYLTSKNVDGPRRSAELLLARVLDLDRLGLYLAHDRPVNEGEKQQMRDWIARRGQHEPLAYLLGDWEFYGYLLETTPAALIPRPETEGLVELAVNAAPENARCVDLGTGCGAIAVALALSRPDVEVWAVDVDPDTLALASRNVAKHRLERRVHCVLGSYWEPLAEADAGIETPFDCLISNPPYVDPSRPELLADDVRDFEPGTALFTPSGDAGAPYATIAAGAENLLRSGAPLLFETGAGAVEQARAALESCEVLGDVELLEDLAGLPRYLTTTRV